MASEQAMVNEVIAKAVAEATRAAIRLWKQPQQKNHKAQQDPR